MSIQGNPSAGTAMDFSVPQTSYGDRIVWGGNYIIARVNGQKLVLTGPELQQLLDNGEDVLIIAPGSWEG